MTHSAPHTPDAVPLPSRISLRTVQLCIGLIPLLVVPGLEEYTLLPRLLLLQLATFVMALTWALQTRAFPLVRCSLHLPALAFFLILSASPLWAINPFKSTYDLSKHLTFFLFFLLLLHTLNRRHLPSILRVSAISGGLVSVLGIGEYLGFIPPWIPSTGRPSSTFGFRNLAASYLVAGLPLSGLLFLIYGGLKDRLLGGISSALMFVFLLYTRGRGSWVGLFGSVVLSVGVWMVVDWRGLWASVREMLDRQALIVGGCALLLVGVLGPLPEGFHEEAYTQRFDEKKADLSSAVSSIVTKGGDRGRLAMWGRTLEMVRDAPILGVGLGNWKYIYPLYDRGRMIGTERAPFRPHNDLLWIWSEEGSLGLVCYLALLGTILVLVVRVWKRTPDFQDRLTALACSITVFAVVGTGCFGFPWERIPPSLLFWLALAVVGILGGETEACLTSTYRSDWQARGVVLLIPVLLLASLGITLRYIGFDYHYNRTTTAFLKKDFSGVVREAGSAIAYGPFDPQAFTMCGYGYLNLKNYGPAEENFLRCLIYHPNFVNAYYNLGILHNEQGLSNRALTFYRKALEIVPEHHLVHHNIGAIYQNAGQLDSAIVAYKRAFHTSYTLPYVNLGSVYRKLGLPDSAIVAYKAAVSGGSPSIEAYFNLGNLYTQQREYEKAIEAYNRFLSRWRGDPKYTRAARAAIDAVREKMEKQERL